ncbi:Gfo/Idh/MocA family protein [Atopobium fossor]|uniref:Gfo/Idh/MocA family protein n=1 Tax=Atopobium fossor TaxID=39487 RepID=UPI0004209AE8|nr:Gfo/Idh/MocA family oxidoreductase [Atopobium fossor]
MKIAVVGTGLIATYALPNLASWGWDVAAIVGTERSAQKTRELAHTYHAQAFNSYDSFLSAVNNGLTCDAVYLAVPNHLHHQLTLQTIAAGLNVILEKPFASNVTQAYELVQAARQANVFLLEAITTLYQPNYLKLQEWLPRIGQVRIASVNYSQYSSRYDAFCAGTILPAFDPAKSGGALMDLGTYCISWLVGLFGKPTSVQYQANIARNIDTSGITTLDYGRFKAVAIAAKDCGAPAINTIQGEKGYLTQELAPNVCGAVTLHLNDGTQQHYDVALPNRMEAEFCEFARIIAQNDRGVCEQRLEQSLTIAQVLTDARASAGIVFPADECANKCTNIRAN